MKLLSWIKYFFVASLGILIIASPAYAAANPIATRSNELKVKACQAREQIIKVRMNSLLNMVNNMEVVFNDIAMRVEQFYQNKVVASGKSVSN